MNPPGPNFASPPEGTSLGLGWAITWLVVVSIACLASLVLVFTPETLVNVSILTVPLFVSGWAAVGAAFYARKRPMPAPVAAPLIGGVVGLVLGGLGLALAYVLIWPN